MIIRIVRMTFRPEKVADFLAHFQQVKQRIRAVEGCLHLELWQDKDQPHILMTCSHWESPEYLQKYRDSELFLEAWRAAKAGFAEKAMAFSSEILEKVNI